MWLDVLQVEGDVAALHGRDREQIVHERTQPVGRPVNGPQEVKPGLLVPFNVTRQQAADGPLYVK